MKKYLILLLLMMFSFNGYSQGIIEKLIEHVDNALPIGNIEEHYNENEKWILYFKFSLENPSNNSTYDASLWIDMADLARVTDEGKEGWVTIWINVGRGIDFEIPGFPENPLDFSFGAFKMPFNPDFPDARNELFSCGVNASVPWLKAELSLSDDGLDLENPLSFGPTSDLGVGVGCELSVIGLELKTERISDLIDEIASESESNLDFIKNMMLAYINPLEGPNNKISFIKNLLDTRFATFQDSPYEGPVKSVVYEDLIIGYLGVIKVEVGVFAEDTYRVRVRNEGLFKPRQWDWHVVRDGPYEMEAGETRIYEFLVTPTELEEVAAFWLSRKDLFGIYQIIDKVEVDFSAYTVEQLDLDELFLIDTYQYKRDLFLTFNTEVQSNQIGNYVTVSNADGTIEDVTVTTAYNSIIISGLAPGNYDINVTGVSNIYGFQLEQPVNESFSIPEYLVADFSYDLTNGEAPLTVAFEEQSNVETTSWEWDFDFDGTVDSFEKNPTHTFNSPGVYTVSLKSANENDEHSVVKTNLIYVEETNNGGGGSGTGTLDLYSMIPITVGDRSWLTVYTDPVQEGIPIDFEVNNSDLGSIELVNNGITNNSGYANAEFISSANGEVIITASSIGFESDSESIIIREAQEGGRINFAATYREGNTSQSRYNLHFEDVEKDWRNQTYTVELTSGTFTSNNSSIKSGTVNNDDDLRLDAIFINSTPVEVILSTLDEVFYFTFIPQILNPTAISPFLKVTDNSSTNGSMGGFDWADNHGEFVYTKRGTFTVLNTNNWATNRTVSEALLSDIGDVKIDDNQNKIAFVGDDRVAISTYPDLSRITSVDLGANEESTLQWVNNDNKLAATSTNDFHKLFDSSLNTVQDLPLNEHINDISYAAETGEYAAIYQMDNIVNELWVYQTNGSGTFSLSKELNLNESDEGHSVSFSPDGRYLAASSRNESLIIFDANTGYQSRSVIGDVIQTIDRIEWNPNPELNYLAVLITNPSDRLYIYDMDNGQRVFNASLDSDYTRLKWSRDGKLLAIGRQKSVELYAPFDIDTPQLTLFEYLPEVTEETTIPLMGSVIESSGIARMTYSLNGAEYRDIELTEQLEFNTSIVLNAGKNTLALKVADRFLKESQYSYEIIQTEYHTVSGVIEGDFEANSDISISLNAQKFSYGARPDSLGYFSISVPSDSSYQLLISSNDYTFNPDSIYINRLSSDTTVSIMASFITYTINGGIITEKDIANEHINVLFESASNRVEDIVLTTDNDFEPIYVYKNSSFTVTPTSELFKFTPSTYTIDNLQGDLDLRFQSEYTPDTTGLIELYSLGALTLNEEFILQVRVSSVDDISNVGYFSLTLAHENVEVIQTDIPDHSILNNTTDLEVVQQGLETSTFVITSNSAINGSGVLFEIQLKPLDYGWVSITADTVLGENVFGDEVNLRSVIMIDKNVINNPPIVISTNNMITLDEDFEGFTFGILDTMFTDIESEQLDYKLEASNKIFIAELVSDSLIFTSKSNEFGTDTLYLKAFDQVQDSVTKELKVDVLSINDNPVLSFDQDSLKADVGDTIRVDFKPLTFDVETEFSDLVFSSNIENELFLMFNSDTTDASIDQFAKISSIDPYLGELIFNVEDEDGGLDSDTLIVEFLQKVSSEIDSEIPLVFSLDQNYPNPFNPSTNIKFGIPEVSNVNIELYNLLGQRVMTIVDDNLNPGFYVKRINMTNFASGIYFYRMDTSKFVEVKKLMLIK